MKNTHRIKDLQQVRLLADPLKLQLLQAFAESAKTTKQVAAELGESVTKLYRHVDALHDSGLLEVVEEKQKRGTIERTFRAVARRFEVDHSLFADEAGDEGSEPVKTTMNRRSSCEFGAGLIRKKSHSCGQRSESGSIQYRSAMNRPPMTPKTSVD
ncbi:MAG: helix-turn-helix domain-containing protein [Woeseiaceae bacterium]